MFWRIPVDEAYANSTLTNGNYQNHRHKSFEVYKKDVIWIVEIPMSCFNLAIVVERVYVMLPISKDSTRTIAGTQFQGRDSIPNLFPETIPITVHTRNPSVRVHPHRYLTNELRKLLTD
ncbi:hypothetical protein CEXT_587831 [Caerostris extrusa]|uniref:Uncharacterized protein n=1 Tax=Caerostris extrusa TaxID=172846 RepID=A0AAV4NPA9_CAEEX|nr:hypothetical protein CEXT_587831 [Caerostris extrusa]